MAGWQFGGNDLQRQRLAQSLLQSGTSSGPVDHWAQGAARVGQAMLGGYMARKAQQGQQAQNNSLADKMAGYFGLAGSPPAAAPALAPATPPVAVPTASPPPSVLPAPDATTPVAAMETPAPMPTDVAMAQPGMGYDPSQWLGSIFKTG